MTEPTLYVTEGQIIQRMGVGQKAGRKALQKMREHPKFPTKTIGGKRYWPSVKDFLDLWNGRSEGVRIDPVVQERGEKALYRGRAWVNLQAAEARLEERVRRRPALEAAKARVEADRLKREADGLPPTESRLPQPKIQNRKLTPPSTGETPGDCI